MASAGRARVAGGDHRLSRRVRALRAVLIEMQDKLSRRAGVCRILGGTPRPKHLAVRFC